MGANEEYFQAGVEYLDEMHPGWRVYIDTKTVDVKSSETCILAQIDRQLKREAYGSFYDYLFRYGHSLGSRWANEHGFGINLPVSAPDEAIEAERNELNAWWVSEIEKARPEEGQKEGQIA